MNYVFLRPPGSAVHRYMLFGFCYASEGNLPLRTTVLLRNVETAGADHCGLAIAYGALDEDSLHRLRSSGVRKARDMATGAT